MINQLTIIEAIAILTKKGYDPKMSDCGEWLSLENDVPWWSLPRKVQVSRNNTISQHDLEWLTK